MVISSIISTIIGLFFTFIGISTGVGEHDDFYDDSSLIEVTIAILGTAFIVTAIILCYSACYT